MREAEKNAHGVYAPHEVLTLPCDRKGWRGVETARIKLADLGGYWIWTTSFQMHSGDCLGSSSPLMDDTRDGVPNSSRAPTRDAAIERASARLRRTLEPRAKEYADARAVLAWLETLRPAQGDLFS